MPRISLDTDKDYLVTPTHSDARGLVVSGRMRITVGGETYEVGPSAVGFHPSNVLHEALAVENTVAISFKNILAPFYPATKTL